MKSTIIFLRYLTADDPSKYKKCKELFKKAVEGKISLEQVYIRILRGVGYLEIVK